MMGMSPIGWAEAEAASRLTNRSMDRSPLERRFTTFRLDGEAFPAAAGALGVRVVEHEAGGEIIFAPVHDRSDEIQHRGAVDVKIAAGSLDLLVEGLFLGHIVDGVSQPRAAAPRR